MKSSDGLSSSSFSGAPKTEALVARALRDPAPTFEEAVNFARTLERENTRLRKTLEAIVNRANNQPDDGAIPVDSIEIYAARAALEQP